ncbi:MAG: carboxypeptidase-like regulatory domain-containing protein, partial [Sediminibacterium sp.]
MSKFLRHFGLFCMAAMVALNANAQTAGTVKGTVKNSTNAETLTAVTVSLKGSSNGTYTSDKGTFTLPVSVKPPFTLVFSSVGFESKEVNVTDFSNITVDLKPSFVLGSEVVVAASRVSERILESPVTIERINTNAIKSAPATNYYDILANLKGVDIVAASLTFKSISTRGFNGSGNTRLNQLIDGMDNQAPGLNFSVGSVIGLTELDVDNIELLPGASSALYGAGGMNGTVLINSKSPFKYQGLSFQIKQGIKDVDNYQRPQSAYKDYAVRFAQKVGNRFAYKVGLQYMEAQDWLANNTQNYSRTTGTQNGQTIGGTRYHDPNYDGVNVYGDETTSSLSGVYDGVKAGIIGTLTQAYTPVYGAAAGAYATGAYNQLYGATALFSSLGKYAAFLGSQNAALAPYAPFLYGNAKGYFTGVNVSRTGYNEIDVIDPVTKNVKVTGAIHYKVNDDVEASLSAYTGQGNTVYTGSDRYSLKDLKMSQFKFELKAKDWYVRAYATLENSGNSFNSTIASRYFNEAWKSSTTWYPTYAGAYVAARDAGLDILASHAAARTKADEGRPTGNISQDPRFKSIISTPISKGGALFLDRTSLYVVEGQY